MEVNFSDVGIYGPAKARDLWEHMGLDTLNRSYSVEVPAHGVVLIRLSVPKP